MSSSSKTQWHHLLGRMLELLLSPLNVQVLTDSQVMGNPPRADVLLLRREGATWTEARRARLADGLRDTRAGHLLLEFKRSEGLTVDALHQILAYNHLYARNRALRRRDLASFLISASTPRRKQLESWGYRCRGRRPGVYSSDHPVCRPVKLILLNELRAVEHNVPLKCFATRRHEQSVAFEVFSASNLPNESEELERLMTGLWKVVMKKSPETEELTPEIVMQMGQALIESVFKATPLHKVLAHYSPEQLAEALEQLPPEQRLAGLEPEQRLAGLDPEQRLAGLDPESIRHYLERLEQKGKKH